MIYWGRWLIRLGIIIVISFLEKVMGLPVIMLMLTSLYAGRLDKGWRWGLISIVSLMTAVLFMASIPMAWLVVSLSYLWSKHARQLLPSRVIRLVIGSSVGAAMIAIITPGYSLWLCHSPCGFGQISWRQLIYGGVAIFMSVVWLKRHRLYSR
jgi:hypothetical protein